MNRKIFFIADAFLEDILGGGELNNEELFKMLDKQYKVYKVRSHTVTNAFLKDNKNSFFIVSNFINLKDSCIEMLSDLDYVIYEHDHKYIKSRMNKITFFCFFKASMIVWWSTFFNALLYAVIALGLLTFLL